MKRSAASTTPRHRSPAFLTSVGPNSVSTPNDEAVLSVDPSVARNTLKSSASNWTQFRPNRPGLRFSPSVIVPNSIRLVNRSFIFPLYGPRKDETLVSDGRLDVLEFVYMLSTEVFIGVNYLLITRPRVILITPPPLLDGGIFGASVPYTAVR